METEIHLGGRLYATCVSNVIWLEVRDGDEPTCIELDHEVIEKLARFADQFRPPPDQ